MKKKQVGEIQTMPWELGKILKMNKINSNKKLIMIIIIMLKLVGEVQAKMKVLGEILATEMETGGLISNLIKKKKVKN